MENEGKQESRTESKKDEKNLTKQDAQFVADKLVAVMNALGPEAIIKQGLFELAIKGIEDDYSRYQAIGIMFDPWGHDSKEKFYKQGIKKLKALVMLCEAEQELLISRQTKAQEESNKEQLMGLFGI